MLSILSFFSIFSLPSDRSTKWETVFIREEIIIKERWITNLTGEKTRERRAEFLVEAKAKVVTELLRQDHFNKCWMGNVDRFHSFGKSSPNQWISYTVYAIPWPFKKQDLLSEYTLSQDQYEKNYYIQVKGLDQTPAQLRALIGVNRKYKRLSNYRAEWHIKETEQGRSRVVFTASSTDPPPFPRWMMDPVLVRLFADNFSRFKNEIEGLQP